MATCLDRTGPLIIKLFVSLRDSALGGEPARVLSGVDILFVSLPLRLLTSQDPVIGLRWVL
jgi:hypothetical protein